jgi:hypothetical protein
MVSAGGEVSPPARAPRGARLGHSPLSGGPCVRDHAAKPWALHPRDSRVSAPGAPRNAPMAHARAQQARAKTPGDAQFSRPTISRQGAKIAKGLGLRDVGLCEAAHAISRQGAKIAKGLGLRGGTGATVSSISRQGTKIAKGLGLRHVGPAQPWTQSRAKGLRAPRAHDERTGRRYKRSARRHKRSARRCKRSARRYKRSARRYKRSARRLSTQSRAKIAKGLGLRDVDLCAAADAISRQGAKIAKYSVRRGPDREAELPLGYVAPRSLPPLHRVPDHFGRGP